MKLFRFDSETYRHVLGDSSDFRIQPFIRSAGEFQGAFMTLEKDGVIGGHRASVPQLMIILSGSGTICCEDQHPIPMRAGAAVFWEKGEWHETRTEDGLTVLVIEGEKLDEKAILLPIHGRIGL